MRHVRLAIHASDSLNQANFCCTTEASLENFKSITERAKAEGTAFGSIIGVAFDAITKGIAGTGWEGGTGLFEPKHQNMEWVKCTSCQGLCHA